MNTTASYHSVAILAPGSYTDMSGKRISFSAADLQALAARYRQDAQPAVLNLDHARSGPALGRISALRYDPVQNLLLADIDRVPGRLARAIEHGRWPGRSAELAVTRAADGSVSSLRLKGLALLGARRPAVEGLPPMPPRSPGVGTVRAASAVAAALGLSAASPGMADAARTVPTADKASLVPTSKLSKPHTISFTGGLHD